jgi:hypothetical protein
MSIAAFLHEIEARLKTGQATEHTYRSAVVGTRFGASAARSPAEHPAGVWPEPAEAGTPGARSLSRVDILW